MLKITTFTFIVISTFTLTLHAKEATPVQALNAYAAALQKGDSELAKSYTAKFTDMSPDFLDHYTKKFIVYASGNKISISPVSDKVKIFENCAVIIFSDGDKKGRPDYDPAYLINQNGEWKVFLKITSWQHSQFKLNTQETERFEELEKWFKTEKTKMYAQYKKR